MGARSKMGRFGWSKFFVKACGLGSLRITAWVVVLQWLRACDYSC